MLPVTVLALETALASSVTITIDVLAMANHIAISAGRPAAFDVRLVGPGASLFRPFLAFPEATHDDAALFIIPAQGLSKADCYRTRLAGGDAEAARDLIRAAAASGAHVASSCTGTLLLASTGLLDRRRATTAWWLAPAFRELYPAVSLDTAELILSDGNFTTAGAAMAQMDLMVGLIARHAGAEVAEGCTRRMILDERRSQVPYMAIGLLAASNESIARAAAWARSRLGERIGVDDLAAAVGQSPRTFSRRVSAATGLSPIQFLQQLRVEQAIEMIETTALPFEEVAYRVGYSDPSTLRGLIRRGTGLGPREIRTRARSVAARTLPPPPGVGLGG
ncbi:helix-turn-helix domain-containing protein [Sphingomonas sp. G-3-2-10]|uniref:GlxA family transcriptional regulator n=1 Tax=Sphingomonas sp. G-3-2-10 TaxID=2728838 RepID=UPI00146D588B|nr:helix-turn-helix domain-containing protein [Sphingomonas sp. G-3-2-10]NML05590.1 helix-turn-helix domain-containing protein [Sphingomonas sp. G-3-2-10]